MGTTRRTWFRRTCYKYKTYSGLQALEVILKNLGFVCTKFQKERKTIIHVDNLEMHMLFMSSTGHNYNAKPVTVMMGTCQ